MHKRVSQWSLVAVPATRSRTTDKKRRLLLLIDYTVISTIRLPITR